MSSLEDPEKVLDQSLLDMQNDYAKMRQATAQVIASRKQLEVKFENASKMSDEWKQRAKLALEKGTKYRALVPVRVCARAPSSKCGRA